MVDHESATWVCPECQRRVPRRVATCRCGFTQTHVAAPEIAGESASSSGGGAAAVARTAGALVLVLAGRAGGAYQGPPPPASRPALAAAQTNHRGAGLH